MAQNPGLEKLVYLAAVVVTLGAAGTAFADGDKIVSFDESNFEYSEGIAVNRRGDLFASVGLLGQVRRVPAGSTTAEVFGTIPDFVIDTTTDYGILGLVVDAPGNVYAAVHSFSNPAVRGVWKFDRISGAASKIPGTEAIVWPNDLAFDESGNLYITDSLAGIIWRISPSGDLILWLYDPILLGTGLVGLYVGANGIAYFEEKLYISSMERQIVVEVPILDGGVAGSPAIVADFAGILPPNALPPIPDGLAMDVAGNIWVAVPGVQAIMVIRAEGPIEVIASGDPLDYPSTIAFGSTKAGNSTLYVANFSVGELFGDPSTRAGPGIVALDVDAIGQPLPY
jgi:sugar lactone lactonase YvrE